MQVNSENILYYWLNCYPSNSTLNSQLSLLDGSLPQLKYSGDSQWGAAIPPKKLFGSSLLLNITKVEPKTVYLIRNYANLYYHNPYEIV